MKLSVRRGFLSDGYSDSLQRKITMIIALRVREKRADTTKLTRKCSQTSAHSRMVCRLEVGKPGCNGR
jgi:hypothetical protein